MLGPFVVQAFFFGLASAPGGSGLVEGVRFFVEAAMPRKNYTAFFLGMALPL